MNAAETYIKAFDFAYNRISFYRYIFNYNTKRLSFLFKRSANKIIIRVISNSIDHSLTYNP